MCKNMKKSEIKPALNALKTIKMPKIEDKDLRNTIIKDHMALLGESRKLEAKIDDLRSAHLGALADEQKVVNDLREELRTAIESHEAARIFKEIQSHKDYLDAEAALIKAINDLYAEEVEVTPVDSEKFLEEIQKQDYDLGLIEAIYPMFNL